MKNMEETEAVYLTDSYAKEYSAKVKEIGKSGDTDYVILDKTIFYPHGGGQPSDKGLIESSLGKMKVRAVEYNNGLIKHLGNINGKFKSGDAVQLHIDWELRNKHMQWHTAGHLVDEAVTELYPSLKPRKGVHGIGGEFYIEYEGELSKMVVESLEKRVNTLREKNLKITTEFVTKKELKNRSSWIPSNLPENKKLRVMQIGDRKILPDGGTQLLNTSELGEIRITKVTTKDKLIQIHYDVKILTSHPQKQTVKPGSKVDIIAEIARNKVEFSHDLLKANKSGEFEALKNKYLSKKSGLTTKLLKLLPSLTGPDKKQYGPLLNELKSSQESEIEGREQEFQDKKLSEHSIDLTAKYPPLPLGHLHPTTEIIRGLNEFFHYYGYSVAEGPEIETAEYNFRKLNLPEGHPATDLQDTLFISEPDILLRTHTSSVEARVLTDYDPPIRVVVPGKVYRNETSNKTNNSFFHQYQGFVVDKGITIQHLKGVLELAHKFLFGDNVVLRFRYKYYPEVSPGMGVDMRCQFCDGVGCEVCKHRGYIEMLGSGMIHYNTLLSCGIDPEVYTGFAFGMGLDRFVMSKYGVVDIRQLYGEELSYK